MSTPAPPTVPPPPIEPGAGRRGCARQGLMGCGIAALVVLVGVVAVIMYIQKKPATITDLMMKQIESHYGPDVTDADKESLRSAYAEFRAALVAGTMRQEALDRVRAAVSNAARGSRISHEQVRALTEAFHSAAASPAGATPAPALSPTALPAP